MDPHDADRRESTSRLPAGSGILLPDGALQETSAQLDREYRVLRINEGGRYFNGSPILEACASDEIHSAVHIIQTVSTDRSVSGLQLSR
jgi:hypothetical protein